MPTKNFTAIEPVDVNGIVTMVGQMGGDMFGLAKTLDAINADAATAKLNARLLVAVMIHETDAMRSVRYRSWRNPAGIAIPSGGSVEVWRPEVPLPHQVSAMLVAAFAQKVYRRSFAKELPAAYAVKGMRSWLERSLSFTSAPSYPKSTTTTADMVKPFRDAGGELQFVWAEDQTWNLGVDRWYDRVPAKKENRVPTNTPVYVELTPATHPNRPDTPLDVSRGGLRITIHDTDNHGFGAGARSHSIWQDKFGPDGGVQADVCVHFYVDDECIVQKQPLDLIGYHAGDGCNDVVSDVGCFRSISIEKCVNRDSDQAKVDRNLAELVVRICLGDPAFNWGSGRTKGKFSIERLDQHIWVSQQVPPHDCPHSFRYADYGTDWNEWLHMVDAEWAARTKAKPPSRDYGRPKPPPFLAKDPLPHKVTWKGVLFTLTNRYWEAMKETPVLVAASRKRGVRNARRPLTVDEKARMLYEFPSEGEQWGLTKGGSRIPLRDMKQVER